MNTMNSTNTMHTTNTTSNGVMPCRDVFDSRHFANPFSTRFTRPGKIEPRDCSGQPLAILQLLKQLHDCGGTAAIQGPHGSGKTTLLVHIAGELQQRGGLAASLRLRSWRDAPAVFLPSSGRVPDRLSASIAGKKSDASLVGWYEWPRESFSVVCSSLPTVGLGYLCSWSQLQPENYLPASSASCRNTAVGVHH